MFNLNLTSNGMVQQKYVTVDGSKGGLKVNLESGVKFEPIYDPEEAAAVLSESRKLDEIYEKMNSQGEALKKSSQEQKIDGIIYQNDRALIFFYADDSMSIPNAFSSKIGEKSSDYLKSDNVTMKEKISFILHELGINEYEVSSYDFSNNPNGPRVRDNSLVLTESKLKDFLENPSKQSTLPNAGLGGRLSGLTGIEVMERSQMLDRVKTAG